MIISSYWVSSNHKDGSQIFEQSCHATDGQDSTEYGMLLRHELVKMLVRNAFLLTLTIVWCVKVSFPAFCTEDVEVPVEDELRLPTQTVTAKRGGGGSRGISSIFSIVNQGSYSDIDSLSLQGDAYTYAVTCKRNPGSMACRLLACEIAPSSKECEQRLDTIYVTSEKPDTYNASSELSLHVDFSFSWIINRVKPDVKTKNQRKRKQLEKKCKAGLKQLFSKKKDINLKSLFPSAPSGWLGSLFRNSIFRKVINETKPIMTTGKGDKSPVDHAKGKEASLSFYSHKKTDNFSAGNVTYGKGIGWVIPDYTKDPQWNEYLNGSTEKAHDLVIGFHTHPSAIPNNHNVPYYSWASPGDFGSHLFRKVTEQIHKDALLAIGFLANDKYYLKLIQFNERYTPAEIEKNLEGSGNLPEILNRLFKIGTKMVILDSHGNEIDYFEFFKKNKEQAYFLAGNVLPKSCLSYYRGSTND